jgi:hypothetical protein
MLIKIIVNTFTIFFVRGGSNSVIVVAAKTDAFLI